MRLDITQPVVDQKDGEVIEGKDCLYLLDIQEKAGEFSYCVLREEHLTRFFPC